MVPKLGIWIICTLLFVANGTVNAQKEMGKSISVDTLSISLQDGSSLMLETFYYGDTLDEMCKTYGFVYPIIITQNVYFMVNDTVVKKRVLDCLPTHKHKYKNEEITIQTLPVFDIGVYEGADSCFYYLEGACFCCGVMCPEYLGIYKMDGTLLYEVIAAMDYEYCNGYKSLHDFCVREGVDINNSVQQRSNHKLFQHAN